MNTLEIFLIQLRDVATELRRGVIGELASNDSRSEEMPDPKLKEKDKADGGFKFYVSNFVMLGENEIALMDNCQ